MAYSIRLKAILLFSLNLLVFSAQAQDSMRLKPFSDGVSEDILYETEMRYKDFRFTGLVAIKSEVDGYHIYLISKTGFTLVDAILRENETEWIKTVSFLDKAHHKQKLETDFRLLTQSPLKFGALKKETKHGLKIKLENGDKTFFTIENGQVISARTKGFLIPVKTKISFQAFTAEGLPQSIFVTKTIVDAEIKMRLYENE